MWSDDFELDEAVIHHLVLYGDPESLGGDEPSECGGVAVDHSEFMYAWAPGGQPLNSRMDLISGQRRRPGTPSGHYNNVKKLKDSRTRVR